MTLLRNKQIHQILLELNNIGITEKFDELKRFYEYEQIGYSPEEEFKSFEKIFLESNNKDILTNFIKNNEIYFSILKEKGYIKIIEYNGESIICFPILTDKGKLFLKNYENRNIFDKFEDFSKNYPNSIKILLGFILGIIATIITTYIKTLIN